MNGGDNKPKEPASSPPAGTEAPPQTLEQVLRDKAPEVFKRVGQEDAKRLAKISIEQTVIRAGPLPDPRELAVYNQIIPNGADRIMKMAEAQSAHRIEIESKVIGEQQDQGRRGQYFGFIIGLVGLGLGSYVGIAGQPVLGGVIAGGTVVSLVSAFVLGKKSQDESLEAKQPPTHQRNKKKNRR